MVLRFLTRMVQDEVAKSTAANESPIPLDSTSQEEYSTWDHIERLQFLEIIPSPLQKLEAELVRNVIGDKVSGFEEC